MWIPLFSFFPRAVPRHFERSPVVCALNHRTEPLVGLFTAPRLALNMNERRSLSDPPFKFRGSARTPAFRRGLLLVQRLLNSR